MTRRIFKGLRLAQAGADAVQAYADAEGISWSEAARRALAAGLTELERQRQKGPR